MKEMTNIFINDVLLNGRLKYLNNNCTKGKLPFEKKIEEQEPDN